MTEFQSSLQVFRGVESVLHGRLVDGKISCRSIALLVLPTFNERESIEELLPKVLGAATVDVLIVDDGSTDETIEFALEFARGNERVSLLHRSEKRGLGAAYLHAFDVAIASGYEIVMEFDADGSHPTDVIPALIEAARENDLVIGSRYVPEGGIEGWSVDRRFISFFANMWTRTMLSRRVRDWTAGCKAIRTDALRAIDLECVKTSGYGFQIEVTWKFVRSGLRVREIPIIFRERESGVSKFGKSIAFEAFFLVWRLFAQRVFGTTKH
ncbi:MAG: polyprenol monophosphomannose synthase [Planctomycetes bacterium]|nr:polyprenol monophosphomannose synthase [Planctomycetota bacterium]